MSRRSVHGLTLSLALALTACERDEHTVPACIELEFDVGDCAPGYQPVFDNIWTNTLEKGCATQGTSCHADEDASGARPSGLVFSDVETAWASLQGESDGRPFLDPAQPACSLLIVRLGVDDEYVRMPPGEEPRSEAELCAIAKWMQAGGSR